MVDCIIKLHIPHPKPLTLTYRNLKDFAQNVFKEQISQIPFHICCIFDDVSDQYYSRNLLFSEILNKHVSLKDRAIKKDHVPHMNSDLGKQMCKRNMLKNKHLKDRSNPFKWLLYRHQ